MVSAKDTRSWVILAASVAVYLALFVPLYRAAGPSAALLTALPVMTTAWFLGLWAGVLVGLVTFPVNVLMIVLSGDPLAEALITGNVFGHLFLMAIGATVGRMRDLSERIREQARELEYRALHDVLTGLPNRELLSDRLDHAQARATRRPGSAIAVLFLDLDGFKEVNDSLGHEAGDELLNATGERLLECLRPEDTVSRIGGDEFVILLEGLAGAGDASRAAERIISALQPPFAVAGREVCITASIGIAFSGDTGMVNLMRDADAAMYVAKRKGKDRHEVFGAEMFGAS